VELGDGEVVVLGLVVVAAFGGGVVDVGGALGPFDEVVVVAAVGEAVAAGEGAVLVAELDVSAGAGSEGVGESGGWSGFCRPGPEVAGSVL
jgi:hypothetical protein